jgi:hypothetical protein
MTNLQYVYYLIFSGPNQSTVTTNSSSLVLPKSLLKSPSKENIHHSDELDKTGR